MICIKHVSWKFKCDCMLCVLNCGEHACIWKHVWVYENIFCLLVGLSGSNIKNIKL